MVIILMVLLIVFLYQEQMLMDQLLLLEIIMVIQLPHQELLQDGTKNYSLRNKLYLDGIYMSISSRKSHKICILFES